MRCSVEMYQGAGCTGTGEFTREVTLDTIGWTPAFLNFTFVSGANVSAMVNCERIGLGYGTIDMVYLSRSPGGY